nr:hypothetical protein [uncultured Sediminibacterium sp.]
MKIKKQLFVFGFLLFAALGLRGQAQELEQLKLNLEKLLQLKLMLARAKQGYEVLQNGYNALRDAVKGNYALHKQEMDRLMMVSGQVKRMATIKKMQRDAVAVQYEFEGWYKYVQLAKVFNASELLQINERYSGYAAMMADDAAQVQLVVSPNVLRMNDAERMDVITRLSENSFATCKKIGRLIQEQSLVALKMIRHKKDREAMLRIYGKK